MAADGRPELPVEQFDAHAVLVEMPRSHVVAVPGVAAASTAHPRALREFQFETRNPTAARGVYEKSVVMVAPDSLFSRGGPLRPGDWADRARSFDPELRDLVFFQDPAWEVKGVYNLFPHAAKAEQPAPLPEPPQAAQPAESEQLSRKHTASTADDEPGSKKARQQDAGLQRQLVSMQANYLREVVSALKVAANQAARLEIPQDQFKNGLLLEYAKQVAGIITPAVMQHNATAEAHSYRLTQLFQKVAVTNFQLEEDHPVVQTACSLFDRECSQPSSLPVLQLMVNQFIRQIPDYPTLLTAAIREERAAQDARATAKGLANLTRPQPLAPSARGNSSAPAGYAARTGVAGKENLSMGQKALGDGCVYWSGAANSCTRSNGPEGKCRYWKTHLPGRPTEAYHNLQAFKRDGRA